MWKCALACSPQWWCGLSRRKASLLSLPPYIQFCGKSGSGWALGGTYLCIPDGCRDSRIFPVITSPSCWGHCGIRYDSIQDALFPTHPFYLTVSLKLVQVTPEFGGESSLAQRGQGWRGDQRRTRYGELTGDCGGSSIRFLLSVQDKVGFCIIPQNVLLSPRNGEPPSTSTALSPAHLLPSPGCLLSLFYPFNSFVPHLHISKYKEVSYPAVLLSPDMHMCLGKVVQWTRGEGSTWQHHSTVLRSVSSLPADGLCAMEPAGVFGEPEPDGFTKRLQLGIEAKSHAQSAPWRSCALLLPRSLDSQEIIWL